MGHKKIIVDTDSHFLIDATTRSIKQDGNAKIAIMQHDHNSERFSFTIPRFVDGHDMSECNRVEVHYVNTDTKTKEQIKDKYTVDDLSVNPENENEVIFSWLIARTATMYYGSLAFSIRFLCFDGDEVVYVWNTDRFESIPVGDSCDCNGELPDHYDDNYESWKKEIESLVSSHANNENPEVAHIRQKWAAAIEILFEALSTSAENTKNTISPGGFAVGYNNNVNKCSLAVGLLNVINGYRSFGAGQGLNSYGESNRAYVGQFNAKNGQAVFVVGWGSSDSDRKNVFTVDKVGNGVFAGDVKANGQKLVGSLDLEALRSSFGTQIEELFERVTFCEQGFDLEVERVDSLETTISELFNQIGQFNGVLDTQQMQITALQDKVKALEEIIDDMTAELH